VYTAVTCITQYTAPSSFPPLFLFRFSSDRVRPALKFQVTPLHSFHLIFLPRTVHTVFFPIAKSTSHYNAVNLPLPPSDLPTHILPQFLRRRVAGRAFFPLLNTTTLCCRITPCREKTHTKTVTMSSAMANEIKLLRGSSHPELSELVARRSVH
jgi:hypothetical protein